MNVQFGCVMVPRLPLACELADRPELRGRPVAVAHPDASVVWSVSPAARTEGVVEGQRLSEAMGRCPPLVVLDARPACYDEASGAMLDALETMVPGVEPGGPGEAYVQLDSLVRCYRSPEALHAALLRCVPEELGPRLGVSPTKFVARLAASRASPGETALVAEGAVRAFLDPVPIDELPVEGEMLRRLRLLGITTVGELAALPRRALAAQFGPEGERLGKLLDGAVEPLRCRSRIEWLGERLAFPEPLTSREALLAAAAQLLHRVLHHPQRRHRAARQIVVWAVTEHGKRWESTVTLRRPRGDRDGMWVPLAAAIERAALPGPVSELSVELHGLCPPTGRQEELFERSAGGIPADRWERIEESLRQLRVRYGRCPVGRVVPVEPWSRIPERRWALVELE